MSWLYSIIFAGLIFSNQNTSPVPTDSNYAESNAAGVVRLDETERFEQIYPLNADGRVSVSNVNGSITIETWDRNEVKLESVKIAESRERLAEVEIVIDADQNSFSVETDYKNMRRATGNRSGSNLRVEFKLIVPRNAVLDEIETVNGSVSITNAANMTKASAVNGQVRATNLRGAASLSTVNGSVEADFDQLPTGSKISLSTVNGSANLIIPSDADAILKADTLNGNITNEFGLPVRKGQYVGRDLYGKIGGGAAQIRLNSVNGGLTIRRKNDGKSLNPVTNLLPQKSNLDNDGNYDAAVRKAVKNANKSIAQANNKIAENKVAEEINRAVINGVAKITADSVKAALDIANSEQIQTKITETQLRRLEAMAKMSEADWLGGTPVIEKKSESFAVKSVPKVTINANNCAISIRGWDKPEVRYAVTKIGGNFNKKPLDINAVQNNSDVNINVTNDDALPGVFGMNNVRLEIFVPIKSNLRVVTDGEIRLEGISGDVELNGADEAINVRDSNGNIRLQSADGRIRVLGFDGEISARTAAGDINLEGVFRKLAAHTDAGAIVLSLPEDAGANLFANKIPLIEGLISTKENETAWRIGKGGANFQLQTTDGEIYIRSFNTIKASPQ